MVIRLPSYKQAMKYRSGENNNEAIDHWSYSLEKNFRLRRECTREQVFRLKKSTLWTKRQSLRERTLLLGTEA